MKLSWSAMSESNACGWWSVQEFIDRYGSIPCNNHCMVKEWWFMESKTHGRKLVMCGVDAYAVMQSDLADGKIVDIQSCLPNRKV
jgi:hypothetical protein